MADAGDLQLLPGTRKRLAIRTPGEYNFLIISFVLLALVLGVYFVVYTYRVSQFNAVTDLNNKISAVEQQRNKDFELKLIDVNQQMATTGPLIASHVVWSHAIQRLQGLIEPHVQFETLALDLTKKTITFKALADSYTTVTHQIAAFDADPGILDTTINKVSTTPSGRVEFDTQITIDAAKFLTMAPASSPSPTPHP